jgi:hypothetical protein
MKEKLVSFKTAKLAQEKGFKFDESEFEDYEEMALYSGYYQYAITPHNQHLKKDEYTSLPLHWLEFNHGGHECINNIDQPTQSLLQKHLRDKRIDITVITDWKKGCRVYYVGFSFVNDENKIDIWFSKDQNKNKIEYSEYEDALEVGLFESLKTVYLTND